MSAGWSAGGLQLAQSRLVEDDRPGGGTGRLPRFLCCSRTTFLRRVGSTPPPCWLALLSLCSSALPPQQQPAVSQSASSCVGALGAKARLPPVDHRTRADVEAMRKKRPRFWPGHSFAVTPSESGDFELSSFTNTVLVASCLAVPIYAQLNSQLSSTRSGAMTSLTVSARLTRAAPARSLCLKTRAPRSLRGAPRRCVWATIGPFRL